jgi:CPA1 family monovalent cation:H+ antiporter
VGCGNVGCCDDSDGQHATRHFEETGHPVMRSAEPDAHWAWCYADESSLDDWRPHRAAPTH